MKLWEYRKNRVKITDIDGQIFTGYADFYTSELNDPEGIASLSIRMDDEEGILISFEESEIAKIEIISADRPEVSFPTAVQAV